MSEWETYSFICVVCGDELPIRANSWDNPMIKARGWHWFVDLAGSWELHNESGDNIRLAICPKCIVELAAGLP